MGIIDEQRFTGVAGHNVNWETVVTDDSSFDLRRWMTVKLWNGERRVFKGEVSD
jgi:hypothetical protein